MIFKIEKYWVYQKLLIIIFFQSTYIFLMKQKIRVILKKSYFLKRIQKSKKFVNL